jgi:cyclohexanone monooxygenase
MPDSIAASVQPRHYDVVVVGAGLSGLYMLHRLRGLGMKARVFEAGSGVGGTWFWNRYPGARCDVDSLEYSYSFSDALQQEWHWPERYGTQPELQKYLDHVADRFDLRRDIQFNTRVKSSTFDPQSNMWTLRTEAGDIVTAGFCVMATGNLSTPTVPAFKGLERFQGKWYHSGRWPANGVDFTGQRVGVIGTGSTGIQMVPKIAAQAKHLHVFQRTAHYSVPAGNRPLDPELEREHKATYVERRKGAHYSAYGVAGLAPYPKSALDDTPEARRAHYEARWQEGGPFAFLFAYNDLLTNQASNDTLAEFVREKVRSIVKDQAVAALLAPKDYPIGAKRLCVDTGYYETFNRKNVTLVDVKSAPIVEITARGIRTTKAEYELDAIAFATGFDAMTGALREIDIRVQGGSTLADKWSAGPLTYLGLMVSGFPNMFIVTGPGSPSVKGQMTVSIEQHVDWIADCLSHLRSHGLARIEADREAEAKWVAHVNEVASATLFAAVDSWYTGSNIPGKPRVFMPYIGGIGTYRRKCDEVVARGYEGFVLSARGHVTAAGGGAVLAAAPVHRAGAN